MIVNDLHDWDLPSRDAIDLQRRLASLVVIPKEETIQEIRIVAGADMALDARTGTGFAGVVTLEFPSLREVERVSAAGPLTFPYVPGLLSFREGPILIEAFKKLTSEPDLLFFDGQGIAHPRRLGIASHLGLILDKPSIGCGKSLLCGSYQEPGPQRGDQSPLMAGPERIGTVLRTRDHVKPIFVSPGHRISHHQAVSLTLLCADGYRIPKPTRIADHFVGEIKT